METHKIEDTKRQPNGMRFFKPLSFRNISISVADIGIWLIIILASVSIYSNSFNSPFTFDDLPAITENPYIRLDKLSVEKILHLFLGSGNRPIPIISFAINYYLGGYDVFGFHLANILIHAMCGIFLFI